MLRGEVGGSSPAQMATQALLHPPCPGDKSLTAGGRGGLCTSSISSSTPPTKTACLARRRAETRRAHPHVCRASHLRHQSAPRGTWVNLPRSPRLMVTPEESQQADNLTKPLPSSPQQVGSPPALLRQLLRERPGQGCQKWTNANASARSGATIFRSPSSYSGMSRACRPLHSTPG
jgi:hypothetical protein